MQTRTFLENVVMQFARRFWIAACTLGLILAGSAAQAQQVKLLPNDTEMIFTINLQQILKSEVVKSNKAILEIAKAKINEQLDDKGVSKWFKQANFDLFADLHSITMAVPGGTRSPEEGFVLIEGNFDAEKIEEAVLAAAKDAGNGATVKVVKLGGVNAFEITPKNEKVVYVSILNKKTMVACQTKADLIEAAARAKGGKSAAFKSAVFKSLSETVNNKQSISFVATSSIMTKLADKAPEGAADKVKQAADFLKKMEGFSAAVTIQKNIDFQLGVNTKDADTASQFALFGNAGLMAIKAKLNEAAKQNEKLAPAVEVLKTVEVNSKGANLMIRGQISFETLEKLLQNLPIPN